MIFVIVFISKSPRKKVEEVIKVKSAKSWRFFTYENNISILNLLYRHKPFFFLKANFSLL